MSTGWRKEYMDRKRRRASKHWKQVEREIAGYLGGRRTPLSGSNSQHNTTSDVIGCPTWMYVEVKWDKQYDAFFLKYYDLLIADKLIQFNHYGFPLLVFRFDTWYMEPLAAKTVKGPPKDAGKSTLYQGRGAVHTNVKNGLSQSMSPDMEFEYNVPNRVFSLYLYDTLVKCQRERVVGRKAAFQFHRVHNKRGVYCVCDQQAFKTLNQWRRQRGTGLRIMGTKIEEKKRREAAKRARLLSRALPLQEERTLPQFRKEVSPDEDGAGVY